VTDAAPPLGLNRFSHRELRDLLRAIEGGWLSYPISELAVSSVGIAKERCAELARLLAGLDRPGCRAVVEVALAKRIYRSLPILDLVWTGLEAWGTSARNTRVVVQELFELAQHSVIIGGFRFDHGETLFKQLHARMQQGLEVLLFVDIRGNDKPAHEGSAYADCAIRQSLAANWPFSPPLPRIYYDPDSAFSGSFAALCKGRLGQLARQVCRGRRHPRVRHVRQLHRSRPAPKHRGRRVHRGS
jgi:hypothetical protein